MLIANPREEMQVCVGTRLWNVDIFSYVCYIVVETVAIKNECLKGCTGHETFRTNIVGLEFYNRGGRHFPL